MIDTPGRALAALLCIAAVGAGSSGCTAEDLALLDGGTSDAGVSDGGASDAGIDAGMADAGTDGGEAALELPRIPWEGGAAYWEQFPRAKAGGWTDPGFFPIVIWYNGLSSDAEAQFDKAVGINTYIGMDPATPFSLFEDNGLYWIGGPLQGASESSPNWVGDFLDDEVDGRYTPADGRAYLQSLVDQYAGDGRFDYANFTQIIMSGDGNQTDDERYVNGYTDTVSLDMYWYTVPFCDTEPYRDPYIVDVPQARCRTSSSYGKTLRSLRIRDAVDGKLQPIWQFVEDLNGGPGGGPFTANITPDQLKGAVMDSIINEARGIVYFNQSLSGPCQSSKVVRDAQIDPDFCGKDQVAAMTEVNGQIRQLAKVINTQSYQYVFGTGLDTLLKTSDGFAYVFAMVDDSAAPGPRTFQLPAGIHGTSAEVLFESRTLPIDGSGTFSDAFAAESTYHIYKIALH